MLPVGDVMLPLPETLPSGCWFRVSWGVNPFPVPF